ncbi:MAG: methylmalonyl-CoA mutase small subunit, partial [Bacteroidales bacterium]
IQFNFAVGSNYFMEIAKIRAARLLWSKIVEAYKPAKTESCKTFVNTVTSDWNKTAYDPYVNLLRTTTEAMSAILGGTDSLTIKPFDSIYKNPSPFSERLARNIQIILKEEAYFDKIVDPAAGSYYIENLTDSIAAEAWKVFLEIESAGGFLNALQNGTIQSEIEENARKRHQNISVRKKHFLGTNLYPNLSENINSSIDTSIYSQNQHGIQDTEIKPLRLYRAVEGYENMRLKTERFKGRRPVAFLFTFGNLAMRIARATFASNFFGCAGFEIIEGSGYNDLEEGIKEYPKYEPDIVVACSSDKDYENYLPELFHKINNRSIFVVSGYPEKLVNSFREIGIQYFIHKNSNALELLMEFQKKLGIK